MKCHEWKGEFYPSVHFLGIVHAMEEEARMGGSEVDVHMELVAK